MKHQHTLIFGATSSIAEHCARRWAEQGGCFYLVARDAEALLAIEADLKARGATHVQSFQADFGDQQSCQAVVDQVFLAVTEIDRVLIAHGTLSDSQACEHDVSLTLREMQVNALSVVTLLTLLTQRLSKTRPCTLGVISSVAGDRGRASNHVYGASKALVTAFCSGLRGRYQATALKIMTIKPGPVATPMTRHMTRGLLWSTPEAVAKNIVQAFANPRPVLYVPGYWGLIMTVIRCLPEAIFAKLKI